MTAIETTLSIPTDTRFAAEQPAGEGGDAYLASIEVLRPKLRRSAAAILRRAEDIDDAVQETLLKLIRHAGRFDDRRGTLEALGRTTVRRVALDMLARKNPLLLQEELLDAAAPIENTPLDAEQIRGRLTAAVDDLPDPQRVAFLLVHQEGLKPAEAARELGLSADSLRARLYRARGLLRSALRDLRP